MEESMPTTVMVKFWWKFRIFQLKFNYFSQVMEHCSLELMHSKTVMLTRCFFWAPVSSFCIGRKYYSPEGSLELHANLWESKSYTECGCTPYLQFVGVLERYITHYMSWQVRPLLLYSMTLMFSPNYQIKNQMLPINREYCALFIILDD